MARRPTIKALCGFDTSTLIGLPIEEASKQIVNALLEKKKELAEELNEVHKARQYGYDYVATLNSKIMYIDKAIESRTQDYDEMMFGVSDHNDAFAPNRKKMMCPMVSLVRRFFGMKSVCEIRHD